MTCHPDHRHGARRTRSTLFSGSAELTTKEILKRYHEHAKAPTSTGAGGSPTSPGQTFSRGGRPAPTVQRIETDPSIWQTESSVRHVGGPGGMSYAPSSTQHTPTSQHLPYGLPGPNAPYAHQGAAGGSSESVNGSPNRASMRQSASHLQKPGPMGITGAG